MRVHGDKMGTLNESNIICGAGSDELIGLLVAAFAGTDDEVLYTEHGFLMYKIYTLSSGAIPVEAAEKNLRADVDSLLACVTERTKVVFIANPNNPTGSYLSLEELQRLRRELPTHIILAIDAAYGEYGEYYALTNPQEYGDYSSGFELVAQEGNNNTVMFRTFSKIYGLPAVRLGWMVAPDNIIDVIGRVKSPFNVTTPAQMAAAAAMLDTKYTYQQCELNDKGLKYFESEFASPIFADAGITTYPTIGNFILVNLGNADAANNMLSELEKRNIYIRAVAGYKLPSCLRISVGTEQENEALIAAMRAILTA